MEEQEDGLRSEAARRLDRRRRKMMTPEERLARIRGRPVSQTSPLVQSPPESRVTTRNLKLALEKI